MLEPAIIEEEGRRDVSKGRLVKLLSKDR